MKAAEQSKVSPAGVVILSTAPDMLLAKRIAHILIEERLAACIQLSPPVLSIYEWKGKVDSAQEIGLLIKTGADVVDQAVARIVELHPYEVPEVIVVPLIGGHAPYLQWLTAQTQVRK